MEFKERPCFLLKFKRLDVDQYDYINDNICPFWQIAIFALFFQADRDSIFSLCSSEKNKSTFREFNSELRLKSAKICWSHTEASQEQQIIIWTYPEMKVYWVELAQLSAQLNKHLTCNGFICAVNLIYWISMTIPKGRHHQHLAKQLNCLTLVQ